MKGLRILLVDDDEIILDLLKGVLEGAGHSVHATQDPTQTLKLLQNGNFDLVFLDIMMPGMDGLDVCYQIRKVKAFDQVKVIFLSGKAYDYDRRRAFELGANAYITKPIQKEKVLNAVAALGRSAMNVKFWGVRGTLPVSGARTVKYGGNTSCVSVELSSGSLIIFDAGTGIKRVGEAMLGGKFKQTSAQLFISHPHWDHINAVPFFAPLYSNKYNFEIYGPKSQNVSVKKMISDQMTSVYFPVTVNDFSAKIRYQDLVEETLKFGVYSLSTILLTHPGNCLGYKLEHQGLSLCYITDNELYPKDNEYFDPTQYARLIEFVKDCDVLITDSTYTDAEYPSRVNWGHSAISQVVNFAHEANVKKLCLFHHDPDQSDADIDRKLDMARAGLSQLKSSVVCEAPKEGDDLFVETAPLKKAA